MTGADFPNRRGDPARRFEIALCHPGDPIDLVPEPQNKHDPQAIMILSERGVQLGYVSAERAPLVGRMIADGKDVRAIFQAATQAGAVVRVTFDGSDPELPPAPVPTAAEPDFWPDPTWDED